MSDPKKVRMGKNNRRKGFAFEREVVNYFREHGFTSNRSWGSDGRSRGEKKEVDVTVTVRDVTLRIQTKRKKVLAKDYKPEEGIDAQIYREDAQEPLIMMRLSKFMEMIQ